MNENNINQTTTTEAITEQQAWEARQLLGPPAPRRGGLSMDNLHLSKRELKRVRYSASTAEMAVIFDVQGEPERGVIVYRGLPTSSSVIHRGDWVTTSQRKAEGHAQRCDGHVLSRMVPASSLFYDMFGCDEWGYDGEIDLVCDTVAPIEYAA